MYKAGAVFWNFMVKQPQKSGACHIFFDFWDQWIRKSFNRGRVTAVYMGRRPEQVLYPYNKVLDVTG